MIFNVGVPVKTRILEITPPTVTVGTYTYNGSPQGPTISAYDSNLITVTNATGTDAGEYTLSVSLKNKATYRWNDGSTVDKLYNYTIEKAAGSITVSANSITIASGDPVDSTISVSSPNGSAFTVTSGNNDIIKSPSVSNGKLNLDASRSISGTTTVTITTNASTNYLPATTTVSVTVTLTTVTWASGTVQQIAAMLRAHYGGVINIHNYWQVGDSRTISLSAYEAYEYYDIPSMPAQNLTFILVHSGGKRCYFKRDPNDYDVHRECAFVVGAGSCLNTSSHIKGNSYPAGYGSSDIYYWLNNMETYSASNREHRFASLFPDSRYLDGDIFKTTYWYAAQNSSASNRYANLSMFGLPSDKEVTGYYEWSNPDDSGDDFADQFSYYSYGPTYTKKRLGISGSYTGWWLRSINEGSGGSAQFGVITASGYAGSTYIPNEYYFGICPHTII